MLTPEIPKVQPHDHEAEQAVLLVDQVDEVGVLAARVAALAAAAHAGVALAHNAAEAAVGVAGADGVALAACRQGRGALHAAEVVVAELIGKAGPLDPPAAAQAGLLHQPLAAQGAGGGALRLDGLAAGEVELVG